MTESVHVLLPAAVDDPRRPSGGNVYGRRACAGLAALGWTVHEHVVTDLGTTLAGIPDGALVLVDGLLTAPVPPGLDHRIPAAHTDRLRLVVLVHLPWGHAASSLRGPERALLAEVDGLVTTSRWTRDWLVGHYDLDPGRVHVARPGADPAPLAEGSASGDRLLSVGPLVPGKGHDVLVEALALLGDLGWRWEHVGADDLDPGFARSVRERVDALGISDGVRFVGPLPPAVLAARYAASDLLVVPSRIETYGMVVGEALARGLPVIASEVGGLPEALGTDGELPGALVPADDARALATEIAAWLREPGRRARWRRVAAERRTGVAGWDSTARALAAALHAIAGEPSAAGARRDQQDERRPGTTGGP